MSFSVAFSCKALNISYQYALFTGGKFNRWETSAEPRTLRAALPNVDQDGVPVDDSTDDPLIMIVSDVFSKADSVVGQVVDGQDSQQNNSQQNYAFCRQSKINLANGRFAFRKSFKDVTNTNLESPTSKSDSHKSVKWGEAERLSDSTPVFPPTSPLPVPPRNEDQFQGFTSSDGAIVVSIFLPIILSRSESDGSWTADWDYENLLSMESDMRVTRVGTVKWRGWHGNVSSSKRIDNDSPEAGVPKESRPEVERLLAKFNCVPVWVDVEVFGEAYNGFCKGILWPVFHNVSSVYNYGGVDADAGLDSSLHGAESAHSMANSANSRNSTKVDSDDSMGNPSSEGSDNIFDSDHVMGPAHGDGGKQAQLWSAYTRVNKAFSDVIVQHFNEGDLIWIHGFQLLVLPSMLSRKVGRLAKIGIFLHTPFPSSEIFRTLWCREDLLRGMLNADQIGFHLYEYSRHFLTCCRRLLGLTAAMVPDTYGGHNLAVESNGRNITITSIHAGVDASLLKKCLDHPTTQEKVKGIKEQFKGKVLMCAIDRLENLKGAPLKILGLERFLDRRPEYRGKIALIQMGISAFERGDDYLATRNELMRLVERVNVKYPGTIQFQECTEAEMRLMQRVALLRAADVVLITSLRDGLNRLPMEFVVAHSDALSVGIDNYRRSDGGEAGAVRIRPGICILSEFASCARVMRGSIHVNPWKVADIAHAIECSLEMDVDEHRRRMKYDSEFVNRVTITRWAMAVLLDLKGVKKSAETTQYSGAGLGLGFRLLGMNSGFTALDTNKVGKSYRMAQRRVIMLDYGGTILNDTDDKSNISRFALTKANSTQKRSTPQEELIETLNSLCSDPKNVVFVVSGKERSALTETLGSVKGLGLAAEHGMYYSMPHCDGRNSDGQRNWEVMVSGQDRSWRPAALTIMEVYCSRTHGSYIEQTESKILWQYRDADPDFGALQAKELEDHLQSVLKNFNVDVLRGGEGSGGYIEVRPKGVDKGVLLRRVLEALETKRERKISQGQDSSNTASAKRVDFTLILGDDNCDEPMFTEMKSIGKEVKEIRRVGKSTNQIKELAVAPNIKYFTATVGKKPSEAESFLNDVDEVAELLKSLTKISTREKRFFSSVDLPSMDAGKGFGGGLGGLGTTAQDFLSSMSSARNNETISAGITRSVSMGNFKPSATSLFGSTPPPPKSLNHYLQNVGDAGGGEDEEDNFF
ncbi:hypothetical protein TrVE_jg11779 [Triparma verrucosa]|uniref:Uncharacterized protein n=1 Tax=Triparma verrucosa TaxID=1606542 RepID=A0A9W7CE70_9STRA|nr:hypothetical protein TrVE_jg11779 [Triparma verrucosa]